MPRVTSRGKSTDERSTSSLRINRELLYQARIAALGARKPLWKWLEEAVDEKLKRESRRRGETVATT